MGLKSFRFMSPANTLILGGSQIIHMSKKPWTSRKNTLILNIFQYHSHFIDVPENTGFMGLFHGFHLMSAIYAICRSKRGDPSRVKEVREKTGHKNPHTNYWKPYPLSNLCDLLFCWCTTAVQLLPTVRTHCVYRLQCWKSLFLQLSYQGALGSAAIPTCIPAASAAKGNGETWDWRGHGGLWFSRIWHKRFL